MKNIFEINLNERYTSNQVTSSNFLVENDVNLIISNLCKHIKTQILQISFTCRKHLKSITQCESANNIIIKAKI